MFGDIGTSPLYAFRQALGQAQAITPEAVMGVVSLAFWALILVVTVKYVLFLMQADNEGEGGVLSLAAMAQQALGRRTPLIFVLGMAGAALFYGDAIITPAISVLSAVEGLRSIPVLGSYVTQALVISSSLAILLVLFLVQSRGTAGVGRWFGPICLVWFVAIAAVGAPHIAARPAVLAALSPYHAVSFILHHGLAGFLVLGSVFLTVTGAEALFADMGHFGRWPIQAAWLFVVLPALLLNYFGQGAFALKQLAAGGGQTANLDWFFQMTPVAYRLPMVVLATLATIIASQAVITGAFSLTNQAIQLGYLPRLTVLRTSESQAGEIFIPQINLLLALGVVLLVGVFHSSDGLAQAYGLAVTGTMAVTTTLAFVVVVRRWRWSRWAAVLLVGPLFALDLVFLAANSLKLLSGGFVPLAIGAALIFVMASWSRGSELIRRKTESQSASLEETLPMLASRRVFRAEGTAVFLTADPSRTPGALLHNLKHNKVLHQQNLIVSVRTVQAPRVAAAADRAEVEVLSRDFTLVILTFGYMETPNVPRALAELRGRGVKLDIMRTSFFVGRQSLVRSGRSELPPGMDRVYIWLSRNAADPTDFFHIPPGRVVELGAQMSL